MIVTYFVNGATDNRCYNFTIILYMPTHTQPYVCVNKDNSYCYLYSVTIPILLKIE